MSRSAARGITRILAFAAAGALTACSAIVDAERPEVASVSLSESSLNLEVGATQQLSATVTDAAGNPLADRQIFWSSEDTMVARVSGTGLVTGIGPGSARIAASVESKSGIASVLVTPRPVASVAVTPASANLPVGQTLQLEVALRDAGGGILGGRQVQWESSAPGVAVVEGNGLVRALAIGNATITASSEGRSGTASIRVLSGPPARIEAVIGGGNGTAGAPLPDSLAVRVTDANGNPAAGATVVWAVTSGEGTIAPLSTVTNTQGIARAQWTLGPLAGNQTASASVGSLTPVSFTARARPNLTASITVEPASATLTALAATRAFTATAYDAHGNPITDQTFTWTSSTTSVAGINSSGVAVAAANGQTTITASVGAVSGSATLQVAQTVSKVTVSTSSVTLLSGDTVRLSASATDANNYPVANATISWGTSNSSIATVTAQGLVRAVGLGTATITAANSGQSASASVRVESVPVASVTVSPPAVTRAVGESAQFTATTYDASGNVLTGRVVTWESSNTQVATVNATGVVTALRPGTSTITARSEGRQGTAVMAVTAGAPASLAIVSGNNQTAAVRTAVPQPLVVQVTDAGGNLISGVTVSWSVTGGGGTLSAASSVTNSSGQASVSWTLGGQAGENTVRASVTGLTAVTFRATAVAGPPAGLAIVSGNNQSAPVRTAVPQPLVVRVTDAEGNAVGGVAITWTVTGGGGTLSAASSLTDAAGQASVGWTLGSQVGQNTARASASGLTAVNFTATALAGPPASLTIVSGNNQTAPVGTSVPQPLVVQVRDAEGNAASGVTVSWSVTGGGGTLSAASSVTDSSGQASVSWTLGSQAGQNTARASVSGLSPVTFTATGVAGAPASLAIASGNNQSATVGTALPQPLVVRVTDAHGNPVPGVTVSWTVTAGGGTVSPQSAVTDAAGQASTGWTLGTLAGQNSARAAVTGLTAVTFTATGVAGAAAMLVIVSGNNQVAPPGATLPDPLVVRVTDVHGNPVAGTQVTWTNVRGSGALNPTVSTTNAQGDASTQWTLSNGPPDQSVEAAVQNLVPVLFTAFRENR